MAEEEQIQASSDEILMEKLYKNIEIACTGSLEDRLSAVDVLINELRESTSSMSSVPKPMKYLVPSVEELTKAYNTFSDPEYRRRLADLLSLLAIVNIDRSYDILLYRLECPVENIGCWGHEYVRCLTLALIRAYKNQSEVPSGLDLSGLIGQISKYYMEHNDEPDACDLLLEVERLRDIIDLVDEESYKRVCIYLLQCYDFLPDPVNMEVLDVLYRIYTKVGKTSQAMVMAIKMNNQSLMHDIFVGCEDPTLQKQLAFLLARQLTVFLDDMDDTLVDISTNASLSSRFAAIADKLGKTNPKTPDDILQTQASLSGRSTGQTDKNLSLMAKAFVNCFHNAALEKDLYYTMSRGEESIMRATGMARAVAVASLGMLHLWNVSTGPNAVSRFSEYRRPEDRYNLMGYLTSIGIASAAVRSEFDVALALIPPHIDSEFPDVVVGCIFGLAMAYAGSGNEAVLELLRPLVSHQDPRVCAYASLGIGLVFVGTCNEDALQVIVERFLVEGPSDELIVQKAYFDQNKKLPIDDGIDVISIKGLSFLRFLEIAEVLNNKVTVVTDNDGNYQKIEEKYSKYINGDITIIKICYSQNNELNTLEPQMYNAGNNKTILKTLFDKTDMDDQSFKNYFTSEHRKTEVALKIFSADNITLDFPEYIKHAITE